MTKKQDDLFEGITAAKLHAESDKEVCANQGKLEEFLNMMREARQERAEAFIKKRVLPLLKKNKKSYYGRVGPNQYRYGLDIDLKDPHEQDNADMYRDVIDLLKEKGFSAKLDYRDEEQDGCFGRETVGVRVLRIEW